MPYQNIPFTFNQGYVSARDVTDLQPGEMVSGVGVYYKPGDPTRIFKEPGRSEHHEFSGVSYIKGMALCQFDTDYDNVRPSGTDVKDKIFAFVDDRLEYVDPVDGVVSGILASGIGISGVLDETQRLHSVHYNDVWYLSTAQSRPYAVEINTRDQIRYMGMKPPVGAPSGVISAEATIGLTPSGTGEATYWWNWGYHQGGDKDFDRVRLTVSGWNFIQNFEDIERAFDGDSSTFAYGRVGETPDESIYGTMETGGVWTAYGYYPGLKADSLIRVVDFKNFPQNSDAQERWLSVEWQVVAGGSEPGGSDVGVADDLGSVGAEVRIEVWLDEVANPDFYLPYPWFDENDVASRWPRSGGWMAWRWYVPNETKSKRLVFAHVKKVQDERKTTTFELPAGLEISGNLRVQCSIAPWEPDNWGGMRARYNYRHQVGGYYPDPYIDRIPIPSKRAMKPAVMRVYDIRVIDGTTSTRTGDIDSVRYAYTEWDQGRELESVPNGQSNTVTFDDLAGAVVTIPAGVENENATHYRIYRSNLDGVVPSGLGDYDWSSFGMVAEIPVEGSGLAVKHLDTFTTPIASIGSPLVATVDVVQDDTSIVSKLRDWPPDKLKAMTVFKGSIVGTIQENPRGLQYSYQGYPESYPKLNVIDKFPLKENDILVAPVALDNVLVILARGVVMTTTELPHVRLGRLIASEINVIEGAPGCVGDYAYTEMELDNFPSVAYVSIHGVYITDGHQATRISEDLDWDAEVNRSTLTHSALLFDKDYKHLIFMFDSDGDGINDKKFIFHLDKTHRKANGMPKVTGPTPAKLVQMVQGQVGDSYDIFSGGSQDQRLYKERQGTVDESYSYTDLAASGVVPFNVMTGQTYADWEYWSAIRGNLRHTNWGSENMTMQWIAGRDDGDNQMTVSKTVSLTGHKGTEVFIGRLGEWHQCQLTHMTSGVAGGIHHLKVKVQPHGSDAGSV